MALMLILHCSVTADLLRSLMEHRARSRRLKKNRQLHASSTVAYHTLRAANTASTKFYTPAKSHLLEIFTVYITVYYCSLLLLALECFAVTCLPVVD